VAGARRPSLRHCRRCRWHYRLTMAATNGMAQGRVAGPFGRLGIHRVRVECIAGASLLTSSGILVSRHKVHRAAISASGASSTSTMMSPGRSTDAIVTESESAHGFSPTSSTSQRSSGPPISSFVAITDSARMTRSWYCQSREARRAAIPRAQEARHDDPEHPNEHHFGSSALGRSAIRDTLRDEAASLCLRCAQADPLREAGLSCGPPSVGPRAGTSLRQVRVHAVIHGDPPR